MEVVNLGRSGLKVSRLALGSWLTLGSSVRDNRTEAIVRAALDAGVFFIDTADIYAYGEAERVLGDVLGEIPRADYVLATKLYWPMSDNPNNQGLSRKHIHESIHASLRRLHTDYVDLYQCHRYDPQTPLEETVRAMGDLITQGKILYWGVSLWSAAQIRHVCHLADKLGVARPISNQPPYNLFTRDIEADVIAVSQDEGLDQIVFSPLAQGVLTGKYSDGKRPQGSRGADVERNHFMGRFFEPANRARIERFVTLAGDMGVSPAHLALAWTLRDRAVASAIFGATSVEQLDQNVRALDVALSPAVLAELDGIFPPPAVAEEG